MHMLIFNSKETINNLELSRIQNEIKTQGFSLVPNYFNSTEVSTFKELTIKALKSFEINDNPFKEKEKYHIHDLLLQNVNFVKIFEDPRLQQLVTLFLGPYWILYAFTSSSVPPKGINYARRIHNDCPRNIPNYPTNIGIIWPLDDYTPDNGALQVKPKSHIGETHLSEDDFNKNHVSVYCKAGDLILFNARLVHRTDVNKTDNFRHALTLNACRHFMKPRFDWVRMIPEEFCKDLNAQALRIIGFDSRIPTSLEEYFVPPEMRIYKAGQE